MLRTVLGTLVAASLAMPVATPVTAGEARATSLKWPPWLSIETPVNPFDDANRGAVFLVHAMMRDRVPALKDLNASAEGIVNGSRRSVALTLDQTSRPGVFALRRQWPASGSWVIRVTLAGSTTALVSLDPDGTVASIRVPTDARSGQELPRRVGAQEIDSALTTLASRHPER